MQGLDSLPKCVVVFVCFFEGLLEAVQKQMKYAYLVAPGDAEAEPPDGQAAQVEETIR